MASYKKSKFFVRLLPTEDVDWENIKIETNKEVIHIRCLQDFCFTNKLSVPRFWSFKTDGIFYNTDQETVYHVVMDGIIQSVFDGLNIVIMACGQTCSGKSFTLGALRSMYEYRGIIPRFITDIFSEIAMKKKEWKVNVSMSSIEILGNTIYDLMASPDTPCNIKKISVTDVHSEKEALALMFKGEEHRRHAPDAPYLGANITNCIITFHFDCLSLIRSNAVLNRSKVHFVDLAGIETVGKRGATSFKEANVQGIANKAKSNLEQVLHNMTKLDNYHTSSHVKRLCRLTEYLSAAFTKGSILRFIVHIRPTFDDLEVSHSALKLGLNMKQIPVASLTHLEPSTELMFRNIKDELNQLKEQILVEKLLSGSSEVQNCNFSQAQLAHLERLAAAYLQGWSSEVNVLGNNEHVITLKVFKEMFSKAVAVTKCTLHTPGHATLDEKLLYYCSVVLPFSYDNVKVCKQNSKDVSKKTRLSSKSPAVQPSKVPPLPPTTLSIDKDMTNDDGNISLNTAPEISQKKVWEEFLAEQNINLKYLEELTNSVKKKKM
ncbi:kinesin-like protein KIF9 [Lycorma delicatula]|uniref:kinesin-like protein KIF9 n=1 Tax=Lycorma delicatula TaxID=130591 RepID=UPI003F512F91